MAYLFNPFTGKLDKAFTNTEGDARYLKLDASNDPVTGDIHFRGDITNYNDALPDVGYYQDSDMKGYGTDYITDKRISHCQIGDNDNDEEGAIRVVDGTFQVYANSTWNDVVINFRLREDSNGDYELEHKPIGFDLWYEVMSGNSDALNTDGTPLVQQYSSTIGVYQPPPIIDGGSF